MNGTHQLIQTKGIYHALPVIPETQKGLTAVVTGANGISGAYMVRYSYVVFKTLGRPTHRLLQLRVLSESPERWTKIYALSRRPPYGKMPDQIEHIAMDFLNSKPEEIASQLKEKGVKADYIFFFAYVQPKPQDGGALWSDHEEMTRVNSEFVTVLRGDFNLSYDSEITTDR